MTARREALTACTCSTFGITSCPTCRAWNELHHVLDKVRDGAGFDDRHYRLARELLRDRERAVPMRDDIAELMRQLRALHCVVARQNRRLARIEDDRLEMGGGHP